MSDSTITEPQTLYSWRAALRSRGLLEPQAAERRSGFVQVMVPGSTPTTPPLAVSLLLPMEERRTGPPMAGDDQIRSNDRGCDVAQMTCI